MPLERNGRLAPDELALKMHFVGFAIMTEKVVGILDIVYSVCIFRPIMRNISNGIGEAGVDGSRW